MATCAAGVTSIMTASFPSVAFRLEARNRRLRLRRTLSIQR